MKMYNKYKPYIRRINGRETADDLRTAMRLAIFTEVGGYVLVQRGFPNKAILVAKTKQEIKNMAAWGKGDTFKAWANRIKRFGKLQN